MVKGIEDIHLKLEFEFYIGLTHVGLSMTLLKAFLNLFIQVYVGYFLIILYVVNDIDTYLISNKAN